MVGSLAHWSLQMFEFTKKELLQNTSGYSRTPSEVGGNCFQLSEVTCFCAKCIFLNFAVFHFFSSGSLLLHSLGHIYTFSDLLLPLTMLSLVFSAQSFQIFAKWLHIITTVGKTFIKVCCINCFAEWVQNQKDRPILKRH